MEKQIYKKNWPGTLIVLMLAILAATPARAEKVVKYGFTFCGVEVTSENLYDLGKIEGVSGKVRYSADYQTLYLENATIKNDASIIVNNSNSNLKIMLYGENNLTAQGGVAIEIKAATTICSDGSGTLNVKSEKSFGILTRKAPLNIEDCIMTVEGSSGIMGESGHKNEALTIRRSDVKAKGVGWGSIANIGKFVLESCAITSPDGAAYDEALKAVAKEGKTVGDIEISFTDYGFKVAGTYVTRENCQDLTVIEGVRTRGDGYAKYDPAKKVLTLKRATIESSAAIDNSGLDGLTIQVKGICRFDVKDHLAGMTVRRNTTIRGAGRLDISGGDLGVFQEGGLLTARECILNISGKDYALYSSGGGGYSNLAVKCADVKFHGGKAAVFNYDSFSIDDCEIQPGEGNVYFDTEKKTFVDGGATANDVTIQSEVYGIRIDHEYITKAIAGDLNAISAVTGKAARYNSWSKELYLYDTTIESVDEAIANLSMNGLEISLSGTNTFTTLEETPLYIGAQTTIIGDEDEGGILSVYSDDGNGIVMAADLNMKDCTVGAESGYGSAIKGVNGTEKLSLDFATVEAIGPEGSICNIGGLVIENSDITQPSGATFDAELHGIALNGELVKKVVIEADNTNSIENVQTDVSLRRPGIYTIEGMKMNGEWESLPAGMYIVDGVKMVKK